MGAINAVVMNSSGRPKNRARVVGEVGGMFGGMTKETYTNADGHAVVQWSSSATHLACIYVDGKGFPGKYRSGETYVFKSA